MLLLLLLTPLCQLWSGEWSLITSCCLVDLTAVVAVDAVGAANDAAARKTADVIDRSAVDRAAAAVGAAGGEGSLVTREGGS